MTQYTNENGDTFEAQNEVQAAAFQNAGLTSSDEENQSTIEEYAAEVSPDVNEVEGAKRSKKAKDAAE